MLLHFFFLLLSFTVDCTSCYFIIFIGAAAGVDFLNCFFVLTVYFIGKRRSNISFNLPLFFFAVHMRFNQLIISLTRASIAYVKGVWSIFPITAHYKRDCISYSIEFQSIFFSSYACAHLKANRLEIVYEFSTSPQNKMCFANWLIVISNYLYKRRKKKKNHQSGL